ncbi:MAG TPA: hypothetical protein VFQ25_13275 [Ktedonobacterales bacterium]|nr:hypothetical protein [Ktedonobacterales bacterium]
MDDERTGEGQRAPLWPPDSEPDLFLERDRAPREPGVSDEPTEQAPAMPASTPANPWAADEQTAPMPAAPPDALVSDASTAHMPAAPLVPQAPGAPTHRLRASAATPPDYSAKAEVESGPARQRHLDPAQWPTLQPPAPPPHRPANGGSSALDWARAHWGLLAAAVALIIVLVAGLSVYNYAASLAAQPERLMSDYCGALKRADYKTAYGLLAPSLQTQSALAQYETDSAARDAISGRVTGCSASPAQRLSALSFLNNPRSLIYNVTLTRASAESGQIALSRDASGWHVAALSSSVVGVDLGPLHTEQALCQAFIGRKYDVAYGLLSAPYQHEQGNEAAFARAFGSNLAITGCDPKLSGYTVDDADQRASLQVTLNVTVSGGSASTKLALPAKMTLVREPDGWRVDTITPLLSQ